MSTSPPRSAAPPVRPLVALLAILAGCAAGDAAHDSALGDAAACLADAPTIEIGTGDDSFVALGPDDEIPIVQGNQGAWHVDLAARITGTSDVVEITPEVFQLSTGLQLAGAGQSPTAVALSGYDAESCSGEVGGQRAFVDDQPATGPYDAFICDLSGEPVDLRITVTDLSTGRTTTESRQAILQPDPDTNDCP